MSTVLNTLINSDGSQVFFEPSTGKYYTLLSDNHQPKRTKSNQSKATQQQKTVHKPKQQQNQPNTSDKNVEQNIPNDNHQQQANRNTTHSNAVFQQDPTLTNTAADMSNESQKNATTEHNTIAQTSKRSLNDSDDFTTVGENKARKTTHHQGKEQNNNTQQATTTNHRTIGDQKDSIPLEQLQRAVAHNLPCFLIKFQEVNQLPTVVAVADELYKHFNSVQLQLEENFSVIRYNGNQLKVGVKNKSDYHLLCDFNKWPAQILGKDISVNIPKFVPDQFSLVVRYISAEITIEQVSKEVRRSASTAENFRAIVYPYPRATNDFRFSVADLNEYNGLLRLGHIGVGNKMCVVTPYRPANKLTYCTKCWLLGHTRNKCNQSVQKCRICLHDYDQRHNEICSKQYQCAQCHQNHYSLDADCPNIQQHRNKLNRAVKEAVKEGTIKSDFTGKSNTTSARHLSKDAYSSSTTNYTNYKPTPIAPWINHQQTTNNNQQPMDISNQQLFDKICVHLDERSKEIDARFVEMEQKLKSNEKYVADVRQNLAKIVDTLQLLTQEIIYPIMKSTTNTEVKSQETLVKVKSILSEQAKKLKNEHYIHSALSNEVEVEDCEEPQLVERTVRASNSNITEQNA